MSSKPNYEIYCLYHNKVFPKYYGNQIDQVTFVKMDRGSYIFKSKKHIQLVQQSWFEPIGKEWAEYEFYYSLYKGYKNGLIELPEYIGFIQYDMEFKGKEEKYKNTSIIDFIEELIDKGGLNEKTLISFQPYDFKIIYDQNYIMDPKRPDVEKGVFYENCLETIIRDCNTFTNQNKKIDDFKDKDIHMCGSVFIHRSVFMEIMGFLSTIIEGDKLNVFNKKDRYQGGMLERYFAIYIEYLHLDKLNFSLHHKYLTSVELYKTFFVKWIYKIIKKTLKITSLVFFFKKNQFYKNFCILLTASIDTNGCIYTQRSDPKIREQDYLTSLKLWLTKTKFKIVFCENSGYDLKNIRNLCNKYPNRVEIIQFDGNNYPRYLGKGYGEFKIIERAMNDSVFIKDSENIIKVTGGVFIKNIKELVSDYDKSNIVEFAKESCKDNFITQTVVFIFKKEFFRYLSVNSEYIDDSKGIAFEKEFEKVVFTIVNLGYTYKLFERVEYEGISDTTNVKYSYIFNESIFDLIYIYYLLGKIGYFLQKKIPFVYKILKPYFPDK